MDYTYIITQFTEKFFTPPILAITELIAIIIGLKYCRKDKFAKFFIAFISFDLVILIADWWLHSNNEIPKYFSNNFIRYTNTLISIFEISAYYYFFCFAINAKVSKLVYLVPALSYSILASISALISLTILNLSRTHTSYLIYTLEQLLLLPPTILLLFQIINTNQEIPLLSRPSFWIAVGIFFQSIISIPCLLLISYFLRQKTNFMPFIEATLYYTPLIINTLFISKAFLCKKTLTM